MKYVLIVDDEQLIRYSLSAAFRDRETEVITQPDARGGLKALGDWPFDFCFLDIQLTDANGIDVLKMMRQLAPKTKVIMMTGGMVEDAGMKLIREKAFLFLSKPFDLERVKRVIDIVSREYGNMFHDLPELENRLKIDRRHHSRRSAVRAVAYETVPQGGKRELPPFSAHLLDISDAGTRIRTACKLKPGSRIRFKNSVNEASGIVRWASVEEQTDLCVAGIQFIAANK